MAVDVFPFLHSDLDAPTLLKLFRGSVYSGVLSDSLVTAGSSGWFVSIGATKVLIDGTYVYDDEVKLDFTSLGHVPGNTGHYAVYETYTYSASDPPASPAYAFAVAVPPLQPVVPGNAVRLADIFIPSTATGISSTGVRIVNAPKLLSRDDTGDVVERLIVAAQSNILFTDGAVTYDDTTGNIVLSQELIIQSTVTSKRQQFQNAPALVRGRIAAGTFAVPGTSPNRDVFIYTLLDRTVPSDNVPCALRFLNRLSPDPSLLTELLDPANARRIVFLGVVFKTRMNLAGLIGQLPAADADARKFLRNVPSGQHVWSGLTSSLVRGGLRSAVADITARNALPADEREEGMIAYVASEDMYYSLLNGITNSDWVLSNAANFQRGGLHVVANAAALAAIPSRLLLVGMMAFQVDTNALMELTALTPTWTTLLYLRGGTEGEIGVGTIRPGVDATGGLIKRDIAYLPNIARTSLGFSRSRVINGLEVLHDVNSGNAVASVRGGMCIVAEETAMPVNLTSTFLLELTLSASFIALATPPTYPAMVYIYMRRDGQPRASAVAPDNRGRPSTFDGGFTVNDYCYLGLLRPRAGTGTLQAAWGSFQATHDGRGRREVFFDAAETVFRGNTGTVTLTENIVQVLDSGPASTMSSLFPTALSVVQMQRLVLPNIGAAVGNTPLVRANSIGCELRLDFHSTTGQNISIMDTVIVPNRNQTTRVALVYDRAISTTTTVDVLHETKYIGIIEDVNYPAPFRSNPADPSAVA